jgi:hypothetical protein
LWKNEADLSTLVFLRLLEYYKGVLLLTTNRVSTFDAAFQSRIHLTINYLKLDLRSRRLVRWTFVRPQDDSPQYVDNIADQDLDAPARIDMNGREIKNVVKTARLFASRKGVPLVMEHVETVLWVKGWLPGADKTSRRLPAFLAQLSYLLFPFRLIAYIRDCLHRS